MLIKILKMGFISTVTMTLFSYVVSVKKKEKFLEPLILNQLIYPKNKTGKAHHVAGYIVHYLMGVVFSSVYKLLWKSKLVKANLLISAILGFINGIIGAVIWDITYKLHPKPPKIKLKKYYAQLLIAHVIFGITNKMSR